MLLWLLSDSRALATLLPLSGFVYRHLPLHPAQILPLDKDNIQVHPQLSQSHLCPTETRASHLSLGGAGSTSGDVRMLGGGELQKPRAIWFSLKVTVMRDIAAAVLRLSSPSCSSSSSSFNNLT